MSAICALEASGMSACWAAVLSWTASAWRALFVASRTCSRRPWRRRRLSSTKNAPRSNSTKASAPIAAAKTGIRSALASSKRRFSMPVTAIMAFMRRAV